MKKIIFLFSVTLAFAVLFSACGKNAAKKTQKPSKPNIVVIYFDDLGYGDVGAYGSKMIPTPNIDKLAKGGIRFTKGYASSSTCTPSRYALLTGSYPWRNKNAHILPGSAPLIIGTDQLTIPEMLKKQGYYTGIVGKWHLGLGSGNLDWNKHISPGPNEVGFDYSFILAATQDRVPTVFIENGNIVRLDPNDPIEVSYKKKFPDEITGRDHPELLKMMYSHGHDGTIVNGISRIGHMIGGKSAWWIDENIADTFVVRAEHFIKAHKNEPFFLYFALQQPHVPRTPHPRFVGKTKLGPRGDVIVEGDWCVGEIMKTLENEGLLENTFVVLSSDNGPVLDDGYKDEAATLNDGHKPWGPFRGGKYSLFEAGTRLPFITYWKGHIKPGVSDAMVSQLDFLNSFAAFVGSNERSADGENLMDVFLGKSNKGRDAIVFEAIGKLGYRKGDWVMIPPHRGAAVNWVNLDSGNSLKIQLYNIKEDPGQKNNVADKYPEKLDELIKEYESITGKKVVKELESKK